MLTDFVTLRLLLFFANIYWSCGSCWVQMPITKVASTLIRFIVLDMKYFWLARKFESKCTSVNAAEAKARLLILNNLIGTYFLTFQIIIETELTWTFNDFINWVESKGVGDFEKSPIHKVFVKSGTNCMKLLLSWLIVP